MKRLFNKLATYHLKEFAAAAAAASGRQRTNGGPSRFPVFAAIADSFLLRLIQLKRKRPQNFKWIIGGRGRFINTEGRINKGGGGKIETFALLHN